MKMLASLIAFAALTALAAPSPAVAGRSVQGGGGHVVVLHHHSVIARHRPVIVLRPNLLIARPRPLFLDRPVLLQRPFFAGQPIIVAPRVVVPRSSFFFTVPGTVVIVR